MADKSRFYADLQSLQTQVTGSNNLVTITYPDHSKECFLVDHGLYQGSDEQVAKNSQMYFRPQKLSAVLLTHAHVDHSGRIPMLYKMGASNTCKTYMTKDTMTVVSALLENTAAIIATEQPQDRLYEFEDLEFAREHFEACEYEQFVQITEHIKAMFIKNMHVPGAAFIYVVASYPGEKDLNLFFSGDYNTCNVFSDERSCVPKWIRKKPISLMLLESTYGAKRREEADSGKFHREMKQFIQEGKTIVIPAFAFCRFQNILLELKKLQDEGSLMPQVPIYIDGGLGMKVTRLWKNLENVKNKEFLPENVQPVRERRAVMNSRWQKIIVTTSGMGNYGPAREHLPHFIGDKNAVIYLTGFTAPESTSRKILEAPKGEVITVSGIVKEKKAIVMSTSEFSSHAKRDELIDFVKSFDSIKFLVLNHGEEDAKRSLSIDCLKLPNIKKDDGIGIVDGQTDFRVDCYGSVKTFKIRNQCMCVK